MSTLVYKKEKKSYQYYKLIAVYAIVFVLTYGFSTIYHYFGHGQESLMMQLAAAYPLLTVLFYLILLFGRWTITNQSLFRFGYNAYNSGLGTMITSHILIGVFEIAGTSSPYTTYLLVIGGILLTLGIVVIIASLRKK